MRMRRGAVAVALAAVLSLSLTSCSFSLPEHATGRAGLDALVATIPEAQGAPYYYDYEGGDWSGQGAVYADIDLAIVGQDRLTTIVDTFGQFLADERDGTVDWDEIHLELGHWTLAVGDRRLENDEMREVYRTLSGYAPLEGGHVGRYTTLITDEDDFVTEYATLSDSLIGDSYVGSHGIEVDSDDADTSFTIYGSVDDDPRADAAAYQRMSSMYSLLGATLSDGELDLTVSRADLAAAQHTADGLAESSELTIEVTAAGPDGSFT